MNATAAVGGTEAGRRSTTDVNPLTGSTTATNNPATATNNAATATNQNTGGGGAHNNLPPYITCYMFVRTA
jgi:hypothetical protein